jgi:uncharacterized protein YigA (DUF484 family)
MGESAIEEPSQAAEVADYLRGHPRFLEHYPELVPLLKMPHAEGEVASLASYQLDVLRRRNRELKRKLGELIEVAARNEDLMVRVHAFTTGLLCAEDTAALVRSVAAGLTEDFSTDLVRLLLFRPVAGLAPAEWLLIEPAGAAALPAFADFFAREEPQVGRLPAAMLARVFGEAAASVESAALVRLGDAGLMAVGSQDANRFHPGMGGVFLQLIGDAIATALGRHQGDG